MILGRSVLQVLSISLQLQGIGQTIRMFIVILVVQVIGHASNN